MIKFVTKVATKFVTKILKNSITLFMGKLKRHNRKTHGKLRIYFLFQLYGMIFRYKIVLLILFTILRGDCTSILLKRCLVKIYNMASGFV